MQNNRYWIVSLKKIQGRFRFFLQLANGFCTTFKSWKPQFYWKAKLRKSLLKYMYGSCNKCFSVSGRRLKLWNSPSKRSKFDECWCFSSDWNIYSTIVLLRVVFIRGFGRMNTCFETWRNNLNFPALTKVIFLLTSVLNRKYRTFKKNSCFQLFHV